MANKLYVGGLPYSTSEDELYNLFESQGQVLSAVVISDRDSGRSNGFGFVEMATLEAAQQAIDQFNGKNLDGRNIVVNEARERAPRPRSNHSNW